MQKCKLLLETFEINVTLSLSIGRWLNCTKVSQKGWDGMCLLKGAGLRQVTQPSCFQQPSYGGAKTQWTFIAFSEPAGCSQAFYHGNPPNSLEGPLSCIFLIFFLTIIETSNRGVLWSLNGNQSSGIFEKSGRQCHLKLISKAEKVFGHQFKLLRKYPVKSMWL